jgi:hypothetical protein
MPVRLPNPAYRRAFDDPASAILAFLANSFCAPFSQLSQFMLWAWFPVLLDVNEDPESQNKSARARIHRANTLVRKTTKLLVKAGLISEIPNATLDSNEHQCARIFSSAVDPSLPDDLYESLYSGWRTRGGKVELELFCLRDRRAEVSTSKITRSEPHTAELCRNAVMLAEPERIALPPDIKAAWRAFQQGSVRKGLPARSRAERPGSRGWEVVSKWVDWPHQVEGANSEDHHPDHSKRRLAMARLNTGRHARVVVVPMISFWHREKVGVMRCDREGLTADLHRLLDECRGRNQTLEIWAPLPLESGGRSHG